MALCHLPSSMRWGVLDRALVLVERAQAARANMDALVLAAHHDALRLHVRHPAARSMVLRVAHIMAVVGLLAADLTRYRHRTFLSIPFTNQGFSCILS